jgi:hypothetical protein
MPETDDNVAVAAPEVEGASQPGPAEGGEPQDEFVMPEKFANASAEDIAKAYVEAQHKMGSQSDEWRLEKASLERELRLAQTEAGLKEVKSTLSAQDEAKAAAERNDTYWKDCESRYEENPVGTIRAIMEDFAAVQKDMTASQVAQAREELGQRLYSLDPQKEQIEAIRQEAKAAGVDMSKEVARFVASKAQAAGPKSEPRPKPQSATTRTRVTDTEASGGISEAEIDAHSARLVNAGLPPMSAEEREWARVNMTAIKKG